jgi:hypothetical protein
MVDGRYAWAVHDGMVQVPRVVQVDVLPGVVPNFLKIDGRGVVPVAILGSDDFDVTWIDAIMLTFNGLNVRIVGRHGRSRLQCSVEDVSGDFTQPEGSPDGHPDLVCQFDDVPGDWNGYNDLGEILGRLYDGTPIVGWDSIVLKR